MKILLFLSIIFLLNSNLNAIYFANGFLNTGSSTGSAFYLNSLTPVRNYNQYPGQYSYIPQRSNVSWIYNYQDYPDYLYDYYDYYDE